MCQNPSGKHIFLKTTQRAFFEILRKKSSIFPSVVWAEESKNSLRFEIRPNYDGVPTAFICLTAEENKNSLRTVILDSQESRQDRPQGLKKTNIEHSKMQAWSQRNGLWILSVVGCVPFLVGLLLALSLKPKLAPTVLGPWLTQIPTAKMTAMTPSIVLQLDWASEICTQKNNPPTKQKSYDNSETTVGMLSARRIQTCMCHFCVIHFDLFFEITFQIMSKQLWHTQNQIRLVEYPCAKVSDPSEVPRLVGKLIFSYFRKSSWSTRAR